MQLSGNIVKTMLLKMPSCSTPIEPGGGGGGTLYKICIREYDAAMGIAFQQIWHIHGSQIRIFTPIFSSCCILMGCKLSISTVLVYCWVANCPISIPEKWYTAGSQITLWVSPEKNNPPTVVPSIMGFISRISTNRTHLLNSREEKSRPRSPPPGTAGLN